MAQRSQIHAGYGDGAMGMTLCDWIISGGPPGYKYNCTDDDAVLGVDSLQKYTSRDCTDCA